MQCCSHITLSTQAETIKSVFTFLCNLTGFAGLREWLRFTSEPLEFAQVNPLRAVVYGSRSEPMSLQLLSQLIRVVRSFRPGDCRNIR